LNEEELRGVLTAREFVLDLEEGVELDASLVLKIHEIAFGRLYEWAGKWRRSDFIVGQLVPPRFQEVPTLMYQFIDDLKFKHHRIEGEEDLISIIAFAHHQFVKIHPFNNENGRTARLISDFIAFSNGYSEVILYHREGEERKKIWLKKDKMVFELQTSHKPKQLIVDLNDDILKIRKTPPLLRDIWKSYPDYVVVYGTVKQTESNRAIAERFNRECLGFNERKVFVADVDANDTDLKNKCVILFGGPESNRITERFEDLFPIRLNGKSFSWRGQTYEKATQGVAQVIEHPEDPNLSMVLYGGLGEPATQRLSEASYFSRTNASYVIFERGDKELEHGLWLTDKDLFWKFEQ
jgi:cell filamentation protein